MRALLLRKVADLVEPFARPPVQNIGCLGAGLGRQQSDFATIAYAFLKNLLCIFGVFGDAILGRSRLRKVAQQR